MVLFYSYILGVQIGNTVSETRHFGLNQKSVGCVKTVRYIVKIEEYMGSLLTKLESLRIGSEDGIFINDANLFEEELTTPPRPSNIKRLLNDPRSATIGIDRTPIYVAEKSDIIGDSVDLGVEADSPIQKYDTPCDQAIPDSQQEQVEPEPEIDEIEVALETPEIPEVKESNLINFITPTKEVKKTKRVPLGFVCTNSPVQPKTPINKSWKGINEERRRLGICDTENTPPLISNPPDNIQSAPGKIRTRPVFSVDSLAL